jgi:UDP-N-acetylmuramate dehydrogenase
MIIEKNKALKGFTTFRVGGEAEHFAEIKDKEGLHLALEQAEQVTWPVHVLGGGSNTIVNDGLISGLVLHLANEEARVEGDSLFLGAGVTLLAAANLALENSLSGLEWSFGIPRATVGGAVRGNAGAFGTEMSDLVEEIEVYDRLEKKFLSFDKLASSFSYRHSLFKEDERYLVWSARLQLKREKQMIIKKKMDESLAFRQARYPKLPSAGSVFENLQPEAVRAANPELYERELRGKIGREGRISAGLIIDMAGLKGKTMGGIKVSEEHANQIVNTGEGTAEEILMLISYIKQQVRDKYGLQLREELVYLGF